VTCSEESNKYKVMTERGERDLYDMSHREYSAYPSYLASSRNSRPQQETGGTVEAGADIAAPAGRPTLRRDPGALSVLADFFISLQQLVP
jgi:hypothetical protein